MRAVLYTGKGGVGKTTTAAATAVRAARSGIKTLVMSTDTAHSLGDALAVPLADATGEVVDVEAGLSALQVGIHRAGESWRSVQDYLLQVLHALDIDPVVAEELTSLPGAEEILALLELRRQVQAGPWDLVVVDCAPTAETLRLLALPQALAWHVERLTATRRGVLRSLRPAAAAASGVPLPSADVLESLSRLRDRLRETQAILVSPQTSVRLVLTPERVVIAESRRTLTSLRLYGFAVDQVVVNRVFPQAGRASSAAGSSWLAGWNAAQDACLAEVSESFSPLPIVLSPYAANEPTGIEALAALAAARQGDDADILAAPDVKGMTVTGEAAGFVLRLPLPLVTAAEVELERRGDELVVGVGEHRRILALPAVLRRCLVTSAGVRDGHLLVRFHPDPALWPDGGGRDG